MAALAVGMRVGPFFRQKHARNEIRGLFSELLDEAGVLASDDRDEADAIFDTVVGSLLDGGDDDDGDDEVLEMVAELLDQVLALDLIVPGFLGGLLERYDGMAIRGVLYWVRELVRPNPERAAARQAARIERQGRRLAAQGDRLEHRERKRKARQLRRDDRQARRS